MTIMLSSSVKVWNGVYHIKNTISFCKKKGTGRVETFRLVFLNQFCMMAYDLSWSCSNLVSSTILPQEKKHKTIPHEEVNPALFQKRVSIPQCIVAIPVLVRNARDLSCLKRAVSSVRNIMKPDEHLLVVDDGSQVCYAKAIRELCLHHRASRIRFTTNHGPANARNAALVYTRAHAIPIICFMDSDCMVESSDWIHRHREHHLHSPGIAVGRTWAMQKKSNRGIISRYHDLFGTLNGRQLLRTDEAQWMLPEDEGNKTMLYGPTCNFSLDLSRCPPSLNFDAFHFRKAAFEDVEFCVRARLTHRIPTYFLPTAVVRHDFTITLCGLWKQFWRYGKGANTMIQLYSNYQEWLTNSVPISNYKDLNSFHID
jgi:glycosyltransferase involved in cell wall biosynthesis